jgi:EAL domain-containing protein (putative c-di-GMP-specific phosphodiesterase class I)
MGVHISIDDFGTGYSSLAYLKRLPISEIKIDRSFIKDMKTSESDCRIVRATISLGRDLGLQTVAEGVEDAELCDLLAAFGCDLAQGYHFGRPLSSDLCTEWLQNRQAAYRLRRAGSADRSA